MKKYQLVRGWYYPESSKIFLTDITSKKSWSWALLRVEDLITLLLLLIMLLLLFPILLQIVEKVFHLAMYSDLMTTLSRSYSKKSKIFLNWLCKGLLTSSSTSCDPIPIIFSFIMLQKVKMFSKWLYYRLDGIIIQILFLIRLFLLLRILLRIVLKFLEFFLLYANILLNIHWEKFQS